MKKTLAALAIAGAFSGAAYAQSNVTLYGLIDTYLESAKTSVPGGTAASQEKNVTRLSAGGLNGPRWGLRGTEDLGGGLKAVFTLEGGFNSDNGTLGQGGRIFGRQAFVGLDGGFGSILVGRQYAPIFYTQADSDIDGYTTFSIPGNSFGIVAADGGTTLRQDNQVRYTTPALGPVKAMISWAPGEDPNNSSKRIWGANLSAGFGPANLVLGYHDNEVKSATVNSVKEWAVGGNFTFSGVKLAANYTEFKQDNVTGVDPKIKQWSLGANYTIGAFVPLIQYGETKNDANNGKEKSFEIGGDYNMSARTTIYARFAQTKDTNNATPNAWYALNDIAAGQKNQTIALGLRHKF